MNIKQQTEVEEDTILSQNFRYFQLNSNCPKIHEKTIKKLIKILQKDQWILDMGVYTNANVKSIVEYITEAKSIKLWLGYNARPKILKEISSINFAHLKQLSMAHNQIYSVEAISFINFPKLEELQFRQNVITSTNSFKKLNLPQLKVISLYRNCVKDTIPFCALKSKNLKTIWLQYEEFIFAYFQQLTCSGPKHSFSIKALIIAIKKYGCGDIAADKVADTIKNIFTKIQKFENLPELEMNPTVKLIIIHDIITLSLFLHSFLQIVNMLSKSQVLSPALDQSQGPKGTITFCDWVTKKQVRQVESNFTVRKLMVKTFWDLEHGQYKDVADTELFSLVAEVMIERLNLSKNKKPNIVRQIKQVAFPVLAKLLLSSCFFKLDDNFITSLQFMDHLDCPNLQAIALMNNKIIHIRSFKKTKFPNLNYVGLEKNLIQNMSTISLMQTDNLNQILIEVDSNDKVMGYDITWMTKIKSQQFRQVKFLGKDRIKMTKTKAMLCKKFEQLQIQDKYKTPN